MKLRVVLLLSVLCFCFFGNASASLTDGLVAYYPFEGNAKDASGNGRNGEAYGAPTYVNGVEGNAVSISVGNFYKVSNGYIPGTDSFSISLYFYVPTPDASQGQIPFLTIQGGDFGEGAVFRAVNYNGQSSLNFGFSSRMYAGLENIYSPRDNDSWHHAVAIINRSLQKVEIYYDGVLAESATLSDNGSIDPSWDMLIGAYDYAYARNGYPRFYGGDVLLDELRIYDRALSSSEIQELYIGDTSCSDGGFTQADLDAQYQAGYATAMAAMSGSGGYTSNIPTVGTDLSITMPEANYSTLFGVMNIWARLQYEGINSSNKHIWSLVDFGEN